MNKESISKAIEIMGSQKKLAIALEVSQPLISQFLSGKCAISPKYSLMIESLTNGEVSKESLCPDFPWSEI